MLINQRARAPAHGSISGRLWFGSPTVFSLPPSHSHPAQTLESKPPSPPLHLLLTFSAPPHFPGARMFLCDERVGGKTRAAGLLVRHHGRANQPSIQSHRAILQWECGRVAIDK
ncbi:uncharacterized protein BO72DRAFT_302208 [Aspergillus fijiensis CBS 313.89]|uniref:Uncharacterized protein n=1 Tax=Aspergillus fijiensis CBS 313.89 TaxID=1448319 RepID=A0A8G1RUG2_9EURO|nr:uncharacterized protein BO72DRAFT_302208 [Aspergillus fijiensis CBS 313.89]RAK80332.1 hypothetical protein BO72DRAFT_302208 [Aspergillus fijiensis CBS 313.89]